MALAHQSGWTAIQMCKQTYKQCHKVQPIPLARRHAFLLVFVRALVAGSWQAIASVRWQHAARKFKGDSKRDGAMEACDASKETRGTPTPQSELRDDARDQACFFLKSWKTDFQFQLLNRN
jgi:hypothetical protein